jgi:hypothetical protein
MENAEFRASIHWWCIQARASNELCTVLQYLPRSACFMKSDSKLNNNICGAMELATIRLADDPFQACGYSIYRQYVAGRGWGVLSCVGDHILQEFNTLFLTRFRNYKIALPPQTKA